MTTKTITESEFAALVKLLQETAELEREEARLQQRIDANRAAWLEMTANVNLISDGDKMPAPGVTIATTTKVNYDPAQAYEWATQDHNFPLAGVLLKVRDEAIPNVIALAMNDPKYRAWFELNKTGFEKAAREGKLIGMPIAGFEYKPKVSVSGKALKTNADELRALYTILPDPEPQSEPATDTDDSIDDFGALEPIPF